jgi:hypothetical protein
MSCKATIKKLVADIFYIERSEMEKIGCRFFMSCEATSSSAKADEQPLASKKLFF